MVWWNRLSIQNKIYETHPHGIKVRLKTGEVGRVKM
ncbi:MAG: hypothetical protein COX81_02350 [Candidatus Magasanikbacteria bacterium CG_4_10_14_0_2_um_filter_37_12]|uniref:Uncharacterized protein n=1 Tax=Candidatus Magasanikbacteria bacterium CG_4_10_14_0_2_um_filter_37_12 TaxID=1974637 RepID=A0A2M7V7V9_9BACT|nr:MAG: hypothetical protein COX81_02350 [Candidatus Magasanikbacteria bacterium CG_4_10_14_0_2_um_filter_37_12]